LANSMGSLYIGANGLKSSQNAINTTANNLTNVDTTGYVRQQVVFTDRNYLTFANASISKQQSGLGVTIGDVVHSRDQFLDQSYRSEYGREAFYAAYYDAVDEIETYFQEMEGEAFQDAIDNFKVSMETLANDPSDSVNQNLLIQKASMFLSRAQSVYTSLQEYQSNINTQISDDIDRINELGKTIYDLNIQIQKVESGGMETAMTLRDERDNALDELAGLVKINYSEDVNGIVSVDVEGTCFIDEAHCFEMGKITDKETGFVTPYWPYLSDLDNGVVENVVDFGIDISADLNTDKGELKALLAARGDKITTYRDNLYAEDGSDLTADEYNNTLGMSVMEAVEAELDTLVHGIITSINDALCPNTTLSDLGVLTGSGTLTVTDADGNSYTLDANTKVLDEENCYVGSDGKIPPRELFTRVGCERYTEVTDAAGNTYYLYNEESETDTSKMYTTGSVSVNKELTTQPSLLSGFLQNGEVAYEMGDSLNAIWEKTDLILNPTDTESVTFENYYNKIINSVASMGDVYSAQATSLDGTVLTIDNQRQQVIGISSDEELSNLIKYQNAYNASSRFMNVISEMMETIITGL
jgi:flagellar hook-associated protein 1